MTIRIDYRDGDEDFCDAVINAASYLCCQYSNRTGMPYRSLVTTKNGFKTFKKEWIELFKSNVIGDFDTVVEAIEFETREDAVAFILRWG